MLHLILLFIVLLATWLLLSGMFNTAFIAMGVVSCLIAVLFYRSLYKDKVKNVSSLILRMMLYIPWLVKEIAKSAWDTSIRMWQLDLDISPNHKWIKTDIKDDISTTIFANSITLTPGTVTIETKPGKLHIHALTKESMSEVQQGAMLKFVKKLRP